jgi:hypothetical protein
MLSLIRQIYMFQAVGFDSSIQNRRGCKAEELRRFLKSICINFFASPNDSVCYSFSDFQEFKRLLLKLAWYCTHR